MNHSTPTHDCAAYESLLPLLTTGLLTNDETRDLLAHTATCAHCRAQVDEYAALEAAGRRYYSPAAPLPGFVAAPFKLDDIILADAPEETMATLVPVASQRPRPHRGVWLRILPEVAAILVVALLAAALLANHGGRQQAPLTAKDTAVIFADTVPWGQLRLNGHLTDISKIDNQHPLTLPRGRNSIIYTAAPFPTMRCIASVPAASQDTCKLQELYYPSSAGREIDLQAQPGYLRAADFQRLLAAIQRQLDALSTTIHILPGDHYFTPDGTFATATQAFDVTLNYQIPPSNILNGKSQTCLRTFRFSSAVQDNCLLPGPAPSLVYIDTTHGAATASVVMDVNWQFAPVVSWRYTLPDGQAITAGEGSTAFYWEQDTSITWHGAWQVTLGASAQKQFLLGIANYALDSFINRPNFSIDAQRQVIPAPDGMLIKVGYSTTNSITFDQTAFVLYRAGALTALDSSAETLFPSLPLASAHEMSIARQLGWT
jgi:hypothetical protein